jgi:hypothetical protein
LERVTDNKDGSNKGGWQERDRTWRDQTLAGATSRSPERKPRFSTISDVEIERLYNPLDWQRDGAGGGGPTAVDHLGDRLRSGAGQWSDFDPVRDIGYPGEAPFTRTRPSGGTKRQRTWRSGP